MDTNLIIKLLPVLVEVLREIKSISENNVSEMTIAEVEEMLREAEWPEFDFYSTKDK